MRGKLAQFTQRIQLALFGVLALQAFPAAGAAPGQAAESTSHAFKITLVSRASLEPIDGKGQKLTAHTELRYRWEGNARERNLIVDSVRLKAEQEGLGVVNTFMSREKIIAVQQGRTNEVAAENAPPRLKTMLQESFGVPLCTLQFDARGEETSRKIVAAPGARTLLDNGIIANALLFHTPFRSDRPEWSADKEVSMGNGGYVRGKLRYTRQGTAAARQSCKVGGTLTNPQFKQPDSPLTIRDARYVVSGDEVFDSGLNEWVSGKLLIQSASEMVAKDKIMGTSRGTIEATFEMLPAAAKKP